MKMKDDIKLVVWGAQGGQRLDMILVQFLDTY